MSEFGTQTRQRPICVLHLNRTIRTFVETDGAMQNQEWIDMLRVIPEEQQNELVVVLQNGAEISVDSLFRFEPNFLVARGRVGGTTDEGRAFFVPYDQMLYFRIERVVNLAELRDIIHHGEPVKDNSPVKNTDAPSPLPEIPIPIPVPVTDATAARNALLDRIRAARVTQTAADNRQSAQ